MPKIKLASQRLTKTGVGAGLQTGKLPIGAGQISASSAQVSAPQINANAANVQYTPYKVPEIQNDLLGTALMSGANVAQALTSSAFNFQQRQDQVDADALVLMYRGEMRDALQDYEQTELRDATRGHDGFVGKVDDTFNSLASQASPGVLQRAALRLGEAKSIALDNAAKHKVSQFKLVERQTEYALSKDQLASIEMQGFSHFDTEDNKSFLDTRKTEEDRDSHIKTQMMYAINDSYEKQITAGVDPLEAIQNTENNYLKYKGMADPLSAQEMDEWIMKKREAAEIAAITARSKAQTAYKKQVENEAPRDFANWVENGAANNIASTVPQIRALYDYEAEGEKAVVDIHKDMFRNIVAKNRHLDPVQMRNLLDSTLQEVLADGRDEAYTENELFGLHQAVVSVANTQFEVQTTTDRMSIAALDEQIGEARKEGDPWKYVPPPPNMTDKQQTLWNSMQTDYNRERVEGIPLNLRNNRAGMAGYYSNLLTQGPFSEKHKEELDALAASGLIDWGVWSKLTRENHNMTVNGSSKQERFKTELAYEAAVNRIDGAARLGMFSGGDKRPKDGEEQLEWDWNVDVAKAQANADLVRAVRFNAKSGKTFDYAQWWTDYVKSNYSDGKVTTRSYWADLPGFAGTLLTSPGEVMPHPIEAIKNWKSGQSSVMDRDPEPVPLEEAPTDYLGSQYPLSPEAEARRRGNR